MDKQYARAFFDIVKEDNTLNEAKASFDVFVDVLKRDNDFWGVLNSPKIKLDEKKEIIKNAFKACLSDFILFIFVVLDNGRISKILDIHKEFIYLFNEENKIKVIEVLSASQLSSDEKEKLHNSLIKCYAGYEVIIHNKIDSKIIGGYHILVNGVSIDLSVKRKLSDLQKHILN